ncbi:MAG: BLUF domain-containing protein [Magnetovibrionaceae bacterium]
MVYRLIYTSKATETVSDEALKAILAKAHDRNPKLGLTGILLFQNGRFLQVLEGAKPTVSRLMEKIAEDPRNRSLEYLFEEENTNRLFSGWSMAYVPFDDSLKRRLAGAGDFKGVADLADQMKDSETLVVHFLADVVAEMTKARQTAAL